MFKKNKAINDHKPPSLCTTSNFPLYPWFSCVYVRVFIRRSTVRTMKTPPTLTKCEYQVTERRETSVPKRVTFWRYTYVRMYVHVLLSANGDVPKSLEVSNTYVAVVRYIPQDMLEMFWSGSPLVLVILVTWWLFRNFRYKDIVGNRFFERFLLSL